MRVTFSLPFSHVPFTKAFEKRLSLMNKRESFRWNPGKLDPICQRKNRVAVNWSNFSGQKNRGRTFWSSCRDGMECCRIWFKPSVRKRSLLASSWFTIIIWGICCVCTLDLIVANTSSLRLLRDLRSRYVFAPVRPRLARWEHKRHQGAAGH